MTQTFGPAYCDQIDGKRIHHQMDEIRDYMLNHGWKTLNEIATTLDFPEASVSAQLRHLRKPRFGGYLVEKRRRDEQGGLWEYLVMSPTEDFSEYLF